MSTETRSGPKQPINWPAAIVGAAGIGGVVYGLLLALTVATRAPLDIISLVVTGSLPAVGIAICLAFRGSVVRTTGAAIAAAALFGGPTAVELVLFVWAHPND